ncbi:MAG: lactate racemase domain-containing protein [Acidobacteriota bacterium]
MKTFAVPWGAWFGDGPRRFRVPRDFRIEMCPIHGGEPIRPPDVSTALDHPVDSRPLMDLARGKQNAVVVVEDLTRPARLAEILPTLLRYLDRAGIPDARIRIVIGVGGHAPLDHAEMVKKLGRWVVSRYDVLNHHPYENLIHLGTSTRGTPIHINRYVAEADLKIAMGSVVPHPYAGFGGGAKIVLPGVAGIETLEANHRPAVTGVRGAILDVEHNTARQEMEKIAMDVGLDFIINAVTDMQRRTIGLFTGHPVGAHRAAVVAARKAYSTPFPRHLPEAIVLNAYPKDTELLQAGNVFNVLRAAPKLPVQVGGTVVVTAACSQGRGYHSLHGRGMRLYRKPVERTFLAGRPVIIHAPLLNERDIRISFWEGYPFERTWRGVIKRLESLFGHSLRMAVFPCAPLQILER